MSKHQDFETFMNARQHAASAYVSGNAAPLARMVALDLPATFMCPGGGVVHGAQAVWDRYANDARAFDEGGASELEILEMAAGDGVAYWTGFQKAKVRMHGKPDAMPMKLRVTEVFRVEGDAWKLVHRHADFLTEEKKP
jgi:ketosteroid isomerase-like protein